MGVVPCDSLWSVNGVSKLGKESGNGVGSRVVLSVVACSPLVIASMLDRGAMVMVGRGPVWLCGMVGGVASVCWVWLVCLMEVVCLLVIRWFSFVCLIVVPG